MNRTIVEKRERVAVHPGIEPEFIAAAVDRPLVPVAGKVGISNAVEVRSAERSAYKSR